MPSPTGTRRAALGSPPRVGRSGLLLLLCALACGPGAGTTVPPADVPAAVTASDEARRLVPADAAVVLQVPTIDQFDRAASGFAVGIGLPADALGMEALEELAGTSWWRRHADRFRPALVAWSAEPGGGPLSRVSIVPVREPDRASYDLRDPSVHIDGRYVASSPDEGYVPGGVPSWLASDLPPGHLSLRADAQALLAPLRPMVEMVTTMIIARQATGEVQGMDTAALLGAYQQVLLDALDATEFVEAGVSFAGARVLMEGRVVLRDDSPLAHLPPADCSRLDELAACLDADAGIQTVFAFDPGSLVEGMAAAVLASADSWPEADEEARYEYAAGLRVLGNRTGHVFVGDGSLIDEGLTWTSVFGMGAGEDPDASAAMFVDVMRRSVEATAVSGGSPARVEELTVDGLPALELTYAMGSPAQLLQPSGDPRADDVARRIMERMMGSDGRLQYLAAARDGRMVMTGGTAVRPDRLTRPPTTVPAALTEALAFVDGADARVVVRIDYARILSGMAAALDGLDVPGENPFAVFGPEHTLPLVVALAARGNTWDLRVTADLGDLRTLTRR